MTGVNVNIDTGDLVKALNDTLTFLKGCGIEVVKNVDQAVKFGWPIMVKQAQTQGQIGIILSIIFALVSVLFIIFTISVYKRAENAPLKSDQALTYSGATILCALLFIISFIISIWIFIASYGPLVNPEYYAVKDSVKIMQDVLYKTQHPDGL